MPIEIRWVDDARTIIRMEFVGHWTWEEAYNGSLTGYTMLDSQDHIVNVIIDMRRSTGLPLLSLTHARNMIAKRHPRTGLTVFMGANRLFLSLWKTFSSMYKQASHSEEFAFVRDDQDAFERFASRQNNLSKPTA